MYRISPLVTLMLILCTVTLSGCGVGKIVPIGKDTYMITGFNSAPFSSGASLLTDIYEDAGKYCVSKNLELSPVNTQHNDYAPGRPSRAALTFRCLRENDPENTRPNLRSEPDTIIEVIQK